MVKVDIPVIVRLDGTNAVEGKQTLLDSGLDFKVAMTFNEAANKVTEVLKK
jgi:succinyl-CoA synthetase beta subunit